MGPFNTAGTAILVACSQVDRNAGGNVERTRGVTVDLALIDVKSGAQRAQATLQGAGWFPLDIAPDDRTVLLLRYRSASDCRGLDARPRQWRDAPRAAARRRAAGFYVGIGFAPDGRQLFVTTDRFGEFRQLYRYDPALNRFDGVTADVPWDVASADLTRDRTRLAVVTNEYGRGVPRVYDASHAEAAADPGAAGHQRGNREALAGRQIAGVLRLLGDGSLRGARDRSRHRADAPVGGGGQGGNGHIELPAEGDHPVEKFRRTNDFGPDPAAAEALHRATPGADRNPRRA